MIVYKLDLNPLGTCSALNVYASFEVVGGEIMAITLQMRMKRECGIIARVCLTQEESIHFGEIV